MTGRADFTQEEWELVLEGPPSAGMIVVTAQRGGTFHESIAMAKAYVATTRATTRSRSSSSRGCSICVTRSSSSRGKATAEEIEDYRRFVLTLADRVANAHREGGEMVSDAEQPAIEEISASLGNAAQ